MKATIETKRLVLRNFQLSDAKSMFDSYCHSETITRYLTWYPHENVEATKEFITTIQLPHIEMDNALDLAITLKGEDQVIGSIGTVNDFLQEDYAEIGYVIGEKYWNQGYMSEAFEAVIAFLFTHTPVTRIRSIHHLENQASGRVMQKCGMKYTGEVFVKQKIDKEDLVKCACYTLEKADWIKQNA